MEENENKKDLSIHYSSNSQTWNTPHELFDPLNELWKFTLDVACLPNSALCENYFTPQDDGLTQDWGTNICWCNPPYNDIKSWAKKSYESFNNGATVIVLIPSRTDTKAFQQYLGYSTCICFIKGRLKFYDPDVNTTDESIKKKNNNAPFPSALFVLDKNLTKEKIGHLKSIGLVMRLIDDNI